MEGALADNHLIELARSGDQEAFGELVRRHRSKAFSWARRWASDPHLAEDIVQEALLRAFLHLGTLADMDRFLPWLQRIVRNEALMKLRRGEHSGREHTFTAFDAPGMDWASLDRILHYLNGRAESEHGDPANRLAQKEFICTIRHLLHCLTPKERDVFEAHFFQQLSPAEIARLFRTSTDNVYHSLSRAREKVREERARQRLRDYVRESGNQSQLEKAMLIRKKGPGSGEWRRCKNSFAGAVFGLLPYTNRNHYSLCDVMGLTSQAFRLTVEEETIDATGPHMYFWESPFRDGLRNLGLESEHCGDGGVPPTPYMLNKGITHIRCSISKGLPVIAWDLGAPEFGIIYGFDDEEQLLNAEDAKGKRQIRYDGLGRGLSGGLFLLAVTAEIETPYWEAVCCAMEMAVRHAYGELTFVGYACGLTAYECWIEAFRKRRIDPLGNAYTLDIISEAREYAAAFLRDIAEKLHEADQKEAALLAADAANRYSEAASVLKEMADRFPFPAGGAPNEPNEADRAAAMLEEVKAFEDAGVSILDRLSRDIRVLFIDKAKLEG